jgi:hypothetical protein
MSGVESLGPTKGALMQRATAGTAGGTNSGASARWSECTTRDDSKGNHEYQQ